MLVGWLAPYLEPVVATKEDSITAALRAAQSAIDMQLQPLRGGGVDERSLQLANQERRIHTSIQYTGNYNNLASC